ncbi:MAG: serine/threonine protein kinase [Propionibacteriaceae bacterium]|jgi:serine/threonine protein kinase|nr:serine/threonine protein kinase [Propionibacteriaceae bacterium]
MTSTRPIDPPTLKGFDFLGLLGQGGFADVFEYQQRSPKRVVAIKVLLPDRVDELSAARLEAEANAMAGLSMHPNIVTIFDSGVADDGRPYLVMEEYPPDKSLGRVWRQVRFPLDQVLAIGVQLAGALESAHQSGILHRDVKPANIFTDPFGRPVLGDFGIAMNVVEASRGVQGLSIPWSPPEAFGDNPTASRMSDVWGLAATLYSLLANRPPFELPGQDNSYHMQASRIATADYIPLGRQDVPASLDQVLRTAMAKAEASRYQAMAAFGNSLRQIQLECQLPQTAMDVLNQDRSTPQYTRPDPDDTAGTALRPIRVVDPSTSETAHRAQVIESVPSAPAYEPPAPISAPPAGSAPPRSPLSWGDTVLRYQTDPEPQAAPVTAKPKYKLVQLLVAIVVGLAMAVFVFFMVYDSGGRPDPTTPTPTVSTSPTTSIQDPWIYGDAPAPVNLVGVVEGDQAVFTWAAPAVEEISHYMYREVDEYGDLSDNRSVATERLSLPLNGRDEVCVRVATVLKDNSTTPDESAARACARK